MPGYSHGQQGGRASAVMKERLAWSEIKTGRRTTGKAPRRIPRAWPVPFLIVFQCAVIAALVPEASAQAYEQLRSMAGGGSVYVPPVGDPECVSGCEGYSEDDSGNDNDTDNRAPSLFDRISRWQDGRAQKKQQEEQQKRQEAFNLNEQGNRAYEQKNWDASIALYKKALLKSPTDKVIQENLRRAESEKDRLEESRKARSEYRKRMGDLLAVMPAAKPLTRTAQAVPPVVPLPGFTAEQWKEYLAAQETVAVLYARLHKDGKLSDADSEAFYSALRRRNELWILAMEQPRENEERDNLRLSLPRVVNKALLDSVMGMFQQDGASKPPPAEKIRDRRLASSENSKSRPDDPVATAFVSEFFADKISGVIESETGEAVEKARGGKMKNRYEKMIALGHIAVAANADGIPAAGAETADLLISKLPEPTGNRAEFAVEGGRMYSKVAYRALNRFMVDAMNATGASFNSEAFWKSFNEELKASQKGTKAWIQFGE